MSDFQFTSNWFEENTRGLWDQLIPQFLPSRILEIGSYEGASACYLIEKLAPHHPVELHCIDTWAGGLEHQTDGIAPSDMGNVEARFIRNMKLATDRYPGRAGVTIHKGFSDDRLAHLICGGKKDYFDFIYIDGSHQAPDVLSDAVLAFKLLKTGGILAFDDYIWFEALPSGLDLLRSPKMAIDAFVNLYIRKLGIISAPIHQLYVQKISN